MSKSIKYIKSQLNYNNLYDKHILAKGNHKARQKAKKYLKKTYNKLLRKEIKNFIDKSYF